MANEIDRIMHAPPDKLTKPDLKTLIAYHRGRREGNIEKEETPKLKLDLHSMTGADGKPLIKSKPKFARRF